MIHKIWQIRVITSLHLFFVIWSADYMDGWTISRLFKPFEDRCKVPQESIVIIFKMDRYHKSCHIQDESFLSSFYYTLTCPSFYFYKPKVGFWRGCVFDKVYVDFYLLIDTYVISCFRMIFSNDDTLTFQVTYI